MGWMTQADPALREVEPDALHVALQFLDACG